MEDLKRFNIVPRKTKIYSIPEWMKEHPLRHHFIRGYFDGDGSFYSHLKKTRKTPQFYFNLRGTVATLDTIRDILAKDLKLENANEKKKIRKNYGIGTLEFGGNGVLREIFNYLYKDATVYLERKYLKGKEVFNYDERTTYQDMLTKEVLYEKYKKYKSLEKIAEEFGVSIRTVHKYMRKYEIEIQESTQTKSKRLKLLLSKDNLKTALKEEGSIKGAARKLGVGATTIKRYMNKYNL